MLSDTGAGSGTTGDLTYCIGLADGNTSSAGSVIQFDPTVFSLSAPKTIVLSFTLNLTNLTPTTPGPIVIDGPAPGSSDGAGPFAVTVSGGDSVRVFEIGQRVTAMISGLSINGGLASENGGGVWNQGNLTLANYAVANDTAALNGGGIENDGAMTVGDCLLSDDTAGGSDGGGINNLGELNLTGSQIEDSEADGVNGYGGGLDNQGVLDMQKSTISGDSVRGFGGGLSNSATATVSGSIIANSSTDDGYGGGIFNDGSLTVVDSAVFGNTNNAFGGGIENDAGLSISYSTIAKNSCSTAGAGIDNLTGTLQAVNVTIADNTLGNSGAGAGLQAVASSPVLINTIVADNQDVVAAVFSPDQMDGAAASSNSVNNLIGTGGSGGLVNGTDGNLVGVADPGLGSLAYNGGPTPTIALEPTSPAINAGTNFSTGATTDQRGFARSDDGGIDIGAYELQPAAIAAVTVDWGSSGSAALETAPDGLRLLPAGRQTDLPWLGIHELQITLKEPETLTAADITISGLKGVKYGPVTVTAAPSDNVELFLYDIVFFQPIDKPDRVTIAISGPEIVTYTRRLDVLPGDFFDTGVVTSKDLTAIKNEWTGKHGATPTLCGEITGDGTVNASDYKAAKRFNGARLPKLPKPGSKPPKVVLVRAFVRQHDDFKPTVVGASAKEGERTRGERTRIANALRR